MVINVRLDKTARPNKTLATENQFKHEDTKQYKNF